MSSLPPPPPHASLASLPPPPAERPPTARPIAAWLAATGGGLVLVAAIIVVAGTWQHTPAVVKLAGLLSVAVGLAVGAEAKRVALPATTRAVAHLAAALAAPVGVAAAAVGGATWPVCVLVGGLLAVVTCAVQARRWAAPLLDAAAVVALGLAATGSAAIVPVPVGVLGAGLAVALLAARRPLGAAAMALAAAAAPVLSVVADARIGPGTLARVGATGDVLAWAAPVASGIAGLVLAVVATARRSAALAAAALAAPLIGATTGMATADVGSLAWACLPGITLVGLEAVAALARTRPWRPLADRLGEVLAWLIAVPALFTPFWAAWGRAFHLDTDWLPLVVDGAALAMCTLRLRRSRLVAGPAAGLGSIAIGAAISAGWPHPLVVLVAAALAAGALVGLRSNLVAVLVPLGWGALVLADGRPSAVVAGALAAVLGAVLLELRLIRAGAPAASDVWSAALTLPAPTLAWLVLDDDHGPTTFLVVVAIAVLHVAWRAAQRAPVVLIAATAAGTVAVITAVELVRQGQLDGWFAVGPLSLAAAAAVTWRRALTWWAAHVAAVSAVVALPFALGDIGAGPRDITVAMLIVAVVLTGWSYVTIPFTPLASAGLAASGVAVAVAPADTALPVLTSVAWAVAGAQVALHGLTRREPLLASGGAVVIAGAVVTTWWTTGLGDVVIERLAPYGVVPGDLGVAAIIVVLIAAGALAGRRRPLSSWVTAGPGLAMAALWVVTVESARGPAWSLPVGLAIGLAAVVVGAVRRSAAPLVIGTATLAALVVVTAGPRLARLDSWVWLAGGGLTLLAVAVAVERTVRDGDARPDWRRLRQTWR